MLDYIIKRSTDKRWATSYPFPEEICHCCDEDYVMQEMKNGHWQNNLNRLLQGSAIP
jgi:hypothetical protein